MKRNSPTSNQKSWRVSKELLDTYSLLGQIGLVVAATVVIFVLIGLLVDTVLDARGICIGVGTLLGVLFGGLVCWKLLKKLIDKTYV